MAVALVTAAPGGGCATALLQGRLVEADGTLAVEGVPGGGITRVEWPFGYGVGEEDGTLTLTRVFMTVAREGDLVSVGGGEGGPGFRACGPVTLGLLNPPEEQPVGAELRVTGRRSSRASPTAVRGGYWCVSRPSRRRDASPAGARSKLRERRERTAVACGGRRLPAGLAPGE